MTDDLIIEKQWRKKLGGRRHRTGRLPRPRGRRNSADLSPYAQSATERQVLKAIMEYVLLNPRVVWAHRMNSGATLIKRPDGNEFFMRYGFKGCPDILGQLTDGRLLAIEVKRPKGHRRKEQIQFIRAAVANQAVAFFAESVDDVVLRFVEAFR